MHNTTIDTAMILAAGFGTRLQPFTLTHPKALAVVNGKPVLQRNIEYLSQYDIKNIVVNVHHFPDQIINFIRDNDGFGCNIIISNEQDEVLETGGGLQKAVPLFGQAEHIVLLNVDILTDLDLGAQMAKHLDNNYDATLAVSDRESSRMLIFNEHNLLNGWRNLKTGEEKITGTGNPVQPFAFSGVHIISQSIYKLMPFTGKFSMIDVYLALAKTQKIGMYNHSGAILIDIGTPEKLAKAADLFT